MTRQGGTLVVELTHPGRGAVAVVLVAGPDAVRIVNRCFAAAGSTPLSDSAIGRILLGRWDGTDGEELVVCRRSEEQIEVQCHGGVAAVGAVVERLVREGCRRMTWQEWVRATDADPIRAAAWVALADAPTARTAAILLDQYHGALGGSIRSAAAAIVNGKWQQSAALLDSLLEFRELGVHLTTPWRVVLAGPPNVGKSSLINALAGFERAIVSHVPGTTRDVVTTMTAIDGWPVELADTAGLRAGGDELEAAGMVLAGEAVERADLVLLVGDPRDVDASSRYCESLISERRLRGRYLIVWNKIDLLPTPSEMVCRSITTMTSAVTGEGISALISAIGRTLVPHPPAAGAAVPFMPEQVAAIEAARAAIARQDAASGAAALRAVLAN